MIFKSHMLLFLPAMLPIEVHLKKCQAVDKDNFAIYTCEKNNATCDGEN